MPEARAIIAAAWQDGVGPDDAARLDELRAAAPVGELFAALARLSAGEPAPVPAAPEAADERVLHAVIALGTGVRARDRAAIERGVGVLAGALAELPDEDPHAVAARAWADLALGEVALLVGDLRVARHRFEAVAIPAGAPGALRIEATRRLIDLAVERGDLEAARGWGAKGTHLCERHDRPIQAAVLRRYGLVLSYAIGDVESVAQVLAELGPDDPELSRLGPILLATAADDVTALAIVAATLEEAMTAGDLLRYALCLVIGVRRHRAMGRSNEAAGMIERGVLHLREAAPHLVKLIEELAS